jgi:hypothetical protein
VHEVGSKRGSSVKDGGKQPEDALKEASTSKQPTKQAAQLKHSMEKSSSATHHSQLATPS